MSEERPIDITPLEHSRERVGGTSAASVQSPFGPQQTNKQSSRLSGAVQVVAGGACTLVGIPMLLLPGPGLLAIGAGVALMVNGGRNLLGRRDSSS